MKFAVSLAMAVLLLGMPLGCILASCQVAAPVHPCCPRTSPNLKCPYDTFDSAKVAIQVAMAVPPAVLGIAPPAASITFQPAPEPAEDLSDSYIFNRILRI